MDAVKEARKLRKETKKQRKMIAIMKKALEYYARESRYSTSYHSAVAGDDTPDIVYDKGRVALDALVKLQVKMK